MPEKKEFEKNEKKIAGVFFDLAKMEKALDEIMQDLASRESFQPGTPLEIGFSMRISPEGEVIIEGNNEQKKGIGPAKEPLVALYNYPENILITAEMQGIEEKDLRIKVIENRAIEIFSEGQKSYYKRINLGSEIEGIPRQKLKNGILELECKKK